MLSIELRGPKPDVCPDCEDSGVVLPAKRKLLTEFGVFCSCPIGVEKWETSKERMEVVESELAALPPFPPPRSARSQREFSRFSVG